MIPSSSFGNPSATSLTDEPSGWDSVEITMSHAWVPGFYGASSRWHAMSHVQEFRVSSDSLLERRAVTVVLPPGYPHAAPYPVLFCADGQAIRGFAQTLHDAMQAGAVPHVVVIGAHSSAADRVAEYIEGVHPQRFVAHERLFTTELSAWAHARFHLSTPVRSCGVFGFSNGGAFALAMSVRHRSQFGVTIVFSIAGGAGRVAESEFSLRPIGRYYLSAGKREKPFHQTAVAVGQLLTRHGVECMMTERDASHDFRFWETELPLAMRWAFSSDQASLDAGSMETARAAPHDSKGRCTPCRR